MKSSSASLVGLNEKSDRWISCLLLLFSLPCSEETCGHLFLLELCTSSFFNSCSITDKKPAALETPATKSFSAEINVPMTFLAASSWTPAKLPCRVASWISDAAEQASEVLPSGSQTEQMRVLRPNLVWYEQCLQALFFSFICSFKILQFSYDKPFIFYISWLLLRNTRWSYPLLHEDIA